MWINLRSRLLTKWFVENLSLMVSLFFNKGFSVTHEIKVQVHETENIGELIDNLLGLGVY